MRVGWRLVGVLVPAAVLVAVGHPASAAPAPGLDRTAEAVTHSVLAPGAPAATAGLPRQVPFDVLQLNLCNSGLAACYDGGQSIPEAASVIQAQIPDVVTLNEVCEPDVDTLATGAMVRAWPGQMIVWSFVPARNRQTNSAYLCANGRRYGIGVIGRIAPERYVDMNVRAGAYPDQYNGSNELRVWICLYVVDNYFACSTHLAADAQGVAMAQCKYLMNTAIPNTRAQLGAAPAVLGGDFNLKYQGNPLNVQDCVPAGWFRKGDDDVQHIMATNDFGFVSTRRTGLSHADHPAWLVRLRTP